MRVEYINPFVEATVRVFKTMLGCEVERTGLALHETFTPQYDVTGVIGLSGKASGDIVISFQKHLALLATEALTGENASEINEDVVDAVGELTNMIAGNAKTGLAEMEMELALPTVIVGKNHSIRFPSKVKPISLSFTSDWGDFNIEIGLVEASLVEA
jgi:chemotaxis protein CheX